MLDSSAIPPLLKTIPLKASTGTLFLTVSKLVVTPWERLCGLDYVIQIRPTIRRIRPHPPDFAPVYSNLAHTSRISIFLFCAPLPLLRTFHFVPAQRYYCVLFYLLITGGTRYRPLDAPVGLHRRCSGMVHTRPDPRKHDCERRVPHAARDEPGANGAVFAVRGAQYHQAFGMHGATRVVLCVCMKKVF